jgi:hypothetical protein
MHFGIFYDSFPVTDIKIFDNELWDKLKHLYIMASFEIFEWTIQLQTSSEWEDTEELLTCSGNY